MWCAIYATTTQVFLIWQWDNGTMGQYCIVAKDISKWSKQSACGWQHSRKSQNWSSLFSTWTNRKLWSDQKNFSRMERHIYNLGILGTNGPPSILKPKPTERVSNITEDKAFDSNIFVNLNKLSDMMTPNIKPIWVNPHNAVSPNSDFRNSSTKWRAWMQLSFWSVNHVVKSARNLNYPKGPIPAAKVSLSDLDSTCHPVRCPWLAYNVFLPCWIPIPQQKKKTWSETFTKLLRHNLRDLCNSQRLN